MADDPILTLIGIAISTIGGFAMIGGLIARFKRRPPLEGVLLGLFLGPIGLLIESQASYIHRPIVDEDSLNSLQSMLVYQEAGREFHRRRDDTA